eukprot:CAMPEP_0114994392 /NCGR_PEP_ID=MMETSP0216-20121206/13106_1 /TAXON_ID=223996 /ORGANISM="Protocruzia adherens, Strain Boccale" /LENGTH=47 /DNA_ID= /DNA_START= /DNA_END= /DNA_ORIENTATION=
MTTTNLANIRAAASKLETDLTQKLINTGNAPNYRYMELGNLAYRQVS